MLILCVSCVGWWLFGFMLSGCVLVLFRWLGSVFWWFDWFLDVMFVCEFVAVCSYVLLYWLVVAGSCFVLIVLLLHYYDR